MLCAPDEALGSFLTSARSPALAGAGVLAVPRLGPAATVFLGGVVEWLVALEIVPIAR